MTQIFAVCTSYTQEYKVRERELSEGGKGSGMRVCVTCVTCVNLYARLANLMTQLTQISGI